MTKWITNDNTRVSENMEHWNAHRLLGFLNKAKLFRTVLSLVL